SRLKVCFIDIVVSFETMTINKLSQASGLKRAWLNLH
ncbi:MAG: hypothetical protein ACI9EW_001901, partial [Cellvibrionaceae bacterium]